MEKNRMFMRACVGIFLLLLKIVSIYAGCADPPKGCPRNKISFFLYTEKYNPPHELILDDATSVKNAPFLPNTDFKLIIHGYLESKDSPIIVDLRNAYFDQKPCNVLQVDYSPLAKNPCYIASTFPSVPLIGLCVANMLKVIFSNRPEIKIEQFHVIGFSMGAQISSHVSNHLQPLIIPRITGLDPAFPGFTEGITKEHSILNKQHAKFVDIIHSNMGIFGKYYSGAHYDIYANNGTFQPGCSPFDPSCSHTRALQIFIESINAKNGKLLATNCEDKWIWITFRKCNGNKKKQIVVGEYCLPPTSPKEEGIYAFKTGDKPPFIGGSLEP